MTPERTKRMEELANLCHEQWAGWMKYLFTKTAINHDCSVTIPKEFAERWIRQVTTPYSELSKEEQDSDRKEAAKFMALENHKDPQPLIDALELAKTKIVCMDAGHCRGKCAYCKAAIAVDQALSKWRNDDI